jgi:tRNA U34 2-thiouridine synthase MnmA/TrmU
LVIKNINILSPLGGKYPKGDRGFVAKCKIRYRQADQDCFVTQISPDEYEVKFEEKQRAIAV